MKKIGIILIILIFLVVGLSLAKDAIIKASVENIVSLTTGLGLDIKELKVSLPKTFISVKNMLIINPDQFEDKIMLDMPEVYMDYDLPSLIRKKIHLYDLRIDVKEFTIIKQKDGKTNLDYVKSLKPKDKKKKKDDSKAPALQIDNLHLKIGKIIHKDYSRGREPLVSEYDLNLDIRYKNLKSVDEIIKIITLKALVNTAIGKLTDFSQFRDIASDGLEGGKDILKKTVDELQNILKSPFESKGEVKDAR